MREGKTSELAGDGRRMNEQRRRWTLVTFAASPTTDERGEHNRKNQRPLWATTEVLKDDEFLPCFRLGRRQFWKFLDIIRVHFMETKAKDQLETE